MGDLAKFKKLQQGQTALPESGETKLTKSTKKGMHIRPEDLRLDPSLTDKLPQLVRDYLDYSSPLSDVPDEFLLTPFLATAAAVIGKRRFVKLGGLTIYPTVWTVLFGGSSFLRKSTALRFARAPFKPIEEQHKREYERKLGEWEQRRDVAEVNSEPSHEQKPRKKTLYSADGFSDLTFWEGLRDSQSQISNVAEFTALWNELTRPRNGLDELALSIYDAEDTVRRHTKSAGDITLNNPVWCIAGATTLSSFQKTLSRTQRGSGLLQRILPVCMEERTKEFKALTELSQPDKPFYNKITARTSKLIGLGQRAVPIEEEARALFTRWSHKLDHRGQQLSNRIADIGGYISRMNVYGIKFALIFQQLDRPSAPISSGNMEAAISLCEWLLNHQIYMLDRNYIFNNYYADRLKIRRLIEKQSNNTMTRTDLMNRSNFDKKQLDRALDSEIEAGKIKEFKKKTGGRPLIKYKRVQAT